MAGIYGNSNEDKHFEKMLDEWTDQHEPCPECNSPNYFYNECLDCGYYDRKVNNKRYQEQDRYCLEDEPIRHP